MNIVSLLPIECSLRVSKQFSKRLDKEYYEVLLSGLPHPWDEENGEHTAAYNGDTVEEAFVRMGHCFSEYMFRELPDS